MKPNTATMAMLAAGLAILLQVPMSAAQTDLYNKTPALVSMEEFTEECDQLTCGELAPARSVAVDQIASTRPLCVWVYITVTVSVSVYVSPPGWWVRVTKTITIATEICVSVKGKIGLDQATFAQDMDSFVENLSAADYSGFSTVADSDAAPGLTALRFAGYDAEGNEIGNFLVSNGPKLATVA